MFLFFPLACLSCRSELPEAGAPAGTGATFLESGDADSADDDWQAATEPRRLEFPRDHLAHPDYRIEWWYYTGNLFTADGRRFGYQLTFFRTGLQRSPRNPSKWAVRDLYTAHFAISDVAENRFMRFERTHRGGVDWAGTSDEGRIWNGEWQTIIDPATETHTLVAAEEGNSIQLSLVPSKPLVAHGDAGLSRKGPAPGNASYYYSFTRLDTSGTLAVDGEVFEVRGTSWMDHEFSSSFLEEGQLGWDWFSMQFDSGDELMLYQMRLSSGAADPNSSGTFVSREGVKTHLTRDDFVLTPQRTWRSAATGAEYPISWRVEVPTLELAVTVTAVMANQEMDTSASTGIVYWEGCVDIRGTRGDRDISGRGYLEMTGYAGRISAER